MESNQRITTLKPNCKDCGVPKTKENTYTYKQTKSKRLCFKSRCKECDKDYNNIWISNNRERHNQFSKNYYWRLKEEASGDRGLFSRIRIKTQQLWLRISNGANIARRR